MVKNVVEVQRVSSRIMTENGGRRKDEGGGVGLCTAGGKIIAREGGVLGGNGRVRW
jgi:hypothetical protein